MPPLIGSKTIIATMVFEVPPGMSNEQASGIAGAVTIGLGAAGLLRGTFMELRDENAAIVAERIDKRLKEQANGPKIHPA